MEQGNSVGSCRSKYFISSIRGPRGANPPRRWLLFAVSCALAFAALFAHGDALLHDFVTYDDGLYVYNNPQVAQGLTLQGVAWSFTSFVGGNWNPAVWISHMGVAACCGLHPAWHHLANVLLHVCNALLFFFLFFRATGALWRSALAAALFAVHPVHVESVAWVSERKDVLSQALGLLTLHAYTGYARTGRRLWHSLAFFLLLLGLLAKPMLVVLPVLFLFLDYWPLQRLPAQRGGRSWSRSWPRSWAWAGALVWEKAPFFILAACACAVTLFAQKNALAPLQDFGAWQRLANVLTSYAAYCGKLFWPADLAVLYPLRSSIPLWKSALAGLLLCLATAVVIKNARRAPYAVTGWFWFLIAMLPVIGIVQIGIQSMADRYAYLPFLGLYVLLAWGAGDLAEHLARTPWQRAAAGALACALVAVLAVVAKTQVGHWRNSETLFSHTLAVTEKNYEMHRALGRFYATSGDHARALEQYRLALEVRADAYGYWLLSYELLAVGKTQQALAELRTALERHPDSGRLFNLLGAILYQKGELDASFAAFAQAVRFDPDDQETRKNYRIVARELAQRWKDGQDAGN